MKDKDVKKLEKNYKKLLKETKNKGVILRQKAKSMSGKDGDMTDTSTRPSSA